MDDSVQESLVRLVDPHRGHFAMESGHHGDQWLDLNRLFLKPRPVAPFASRLAGRLSPLAIDAVCGPFAGGAFLAQMVASELDATFCFTERQAVPDVVSDNTRNQVDYRLPDGLRDEVAGKRIAVIDDAINAGFAVRKTLAALRSCGAEPVAVGALLVLGSSGARCDRFDDLPMMTIATLPSALWRPEACPLCARGIRLERRGG